MTVGVPLLDVNVLVAFLWPPHLHHRAARSWFVQAQPRGWATCPITEIGCIRVLAQPAISQGRLNVWSATALFREFAEDDRHLFWPDDLSASDPSLAATLPHLQGPGQLTDRYLLALAAAHGGTFATFDRSVGSGLPPSSELLNHLEIVAR